MSFSLRSLLFCTAAACAATVAHGTDVSYELDTNYSYVAGAQMDTGHGGKGDVSEQSALFRAVVSPQLREGVLLRLGVEWQRYSFGLPGTADIPNTLQTTALIVGADLQLSDNWLVRVEATPGIYGDFRDVSSQDFNVPIVIGGSYIASADLQWILGLEIDPNSRFPVLPGAGVRWKFSDAWVLDAILPTPRLEYSASRTLTLYAGGDIRNTSFHVDRNFGTAHGDPMLNRASVDYTEFRVGAGASWKFSKAFTLEAEAGYMPYREFDFHRTDVDLKTHGGAPYAQIALTGRF